MVAWGYHQYWRLFGSGFGRREYNGKEITPNINKIIEGSTIYFDNCHSQISNGNTSDAEFILNTGFYPIYKSSIYLNSDGVTFKNTLNAQRNNPICLVKENDLYKWKGWLSDE